MSYQSAPAWSPEAIERRYHLRPESQNFAASEYERDRYQATLGGLLRGSYKSAFEPGCLMGELTVQLAQFCERVVAIDIAPSAVARARQRCAGLSHVEIYRADPATHRPVGPFDLIVLSELGYYFSPRQLLEFALPLASQLAPGGELVAVHWLGADKDRLMHGDAVHSLLLAHLPLEWIQGDRDGGFRIDTWIRS